MFRPQFIEPENMKLLGFSLVSDKDNYLKYENNATIHWNKDYNKQFPEPKGKVIIFVNCTYHDDYLFLNIRQDGDSRTVYNGVCDSAMFLKMLLENNR